MIPVCDVIKAAGVLVLRADEVDFGLEVSPDADQQCYFVQLTNITKSHKLSRFAVKKKLKG